MTPGPQVTFWNSQNKKQKAESAQPKHTTSIELSALRKLCRQCCGSFAWWRLYRSVCQPHTRNAFLQQRSSVELMRDYNQLELLRTSNGADWYFHDSVRGKTIDLSLFIKKQQSQRSIALPQHFFSCFVVVVFRHILHAAAAHASAEPKGSTVTPLTTIKWFLLVCWEACSLQEGSKSILLYIRFLLFYLCK